QNQRILDSAGEGIIGIGEDGVIGFANPAAAKILKWSVEGLLGQEPFQLLQPKTDKGEEIVATQSMFSKTFEDGETRKITGELFKCRKGGWIPVEYVIAATFDEGIISGLVVTFGDISKRQKFEEELIKAKNEAVAGNRVKSEFLSIASHELRTPLNAILGMTDLLISSNLDVEQKEFAKTILNSGNGLLSLIDDILELSSVDAGKQVLQPKPTNLSGLVEQVIAILSPSAKAKGLEFVSQIGDELPAEILTDERKFRQILLHLVSNAIKFSATGKIQLLVKGTKQNREIDQVQISVSDQGMGIHEKDMQTIFQPFTQVDSTDTREHGGTGLGLTICKRFVDGMGGTIEVASEVGKGSRFSFNLPLIPPKEFKTQTAPQPKQSTSEKEHLFPANSKILVVEDDPVNLLLIERILKQWQLKTEVAVNGHIALQKLKKSKFDLVLMDIQMPKMDGLTATKQFRKWEKSARDPDQQTPIIAVTAYSLEKSRESCLKAGMNAYLTKPIVRNTLKQVLDSFLNSESKIATSKLSEPITVNRTILVQLKEDMGDDFPMFIKLFLDALPKRINAILHAAEQLDGKAIHLQTHPLKSNSRQFGLDGLADLVENIDNFARTGKTKRAAKLIPQFEEACREAQKVLKAETNSL
ncbi:MAG: response regulator, partial [Magnetococcales bacterium]|nr:response regulator [Magnetococcales bacterium]